MSKIDEKFAKFWAKNWDSKTVQRSALCRSRRELSNEYLLAKFGFDTAENEPPKVWGGRVLSARHSFFSWRGSVFSIGFHFWLDFVFWPRARETTCCILLILLYPICLPTNYMCACVIGQFFVQPNSLLAILHLEQRRPWWQTDHVWYYRFFRLILPPLYLNFKSVPVFYLFGVNVLCTRCSLFSRFSLFDLPDCASC